MPSISQYHRDVSDPVIPAATEAGGEGVEGSGRRSKATHSLKQKISTIQLLKQSKFSPRPCLICSRSFTPDRETGRFCSEKHQIEWTNSQPEHPVIPKVSAQHPRALELRDKRTQLVLLEKADPYTYGFVPDHWELANRVWAECSELLISGGNRAGKTL